MTLTQSSGKATQYRALCRHSTRGGNARNEAEFRPLESRLQTVFARPPEGGTPTKRAYFRQIASLGLAVLSGIERRLNPLEDFVGISHGIDAVEQPFPPVVA